MKLNIIHFSDIHLQNLDDSIFYKLNSIANVLDCNTSTDENIVVVVSGDIANKGTSSEYIVAEKIFSKISEKLNGICKSFKFIFVPGNHDCDFSLQTRSVREALLKSISTKNDTEPDNGIANELVSVQKSFKNFQNKYFVDFTKIYSDIYIDVYLYEKDDIKVLFKCFNTSWMSQEKELPGVLTFPYEKYEEISFSEHEIFTVSILHHPLSWFNPDNARRFKGYLERTSSIVITGHDHAGSSGIKYDFSGESTELVEGFVLQDTKKINNSAFNILKFNFSTKMHCVIQVNWTSTDFYKARIVKDWFSYEGLKGVDRASVGISDKFKFFLRSLEIKLLNKHKDNDLCIDDVFVFPNLTEIHKLGKSSTKPRMHSAQILFENNLKNKKFLIIGEEKSGKTTILKQLFFHYFDRGYMPIYIEGGEIRSINNSDIDKLINKKVRQQYCNIDYNDLVKNDKNKKLLLIDDFHVAKLNSDGKSVFIEYINKYIPNIIITGNELVLVEEISSSKKLYEMFAEYNHYAIKDFGKLLRYKLVEKWNKIGRENFINEKELISENDRMTRVINGIVGNNLVPSYPLYLLTIIQSIEAGTSFSPKNSTFGYYYEFLITRAFGLSGKKPDELDLYYNYATELAWRFFQEKTREFSRVKLEYFHQYFSNEFQKVEIDEIINTLLVSGILCESDACYKFSQKYAYYFFVAKHIAGKLSDDECKTDTRLLVEKISERVHIEEFFNILTFLSHFSKDPFVLATISSKSKNIFSNLDPIKFKEDISVINEMLCEIPKIVMHPSDYIQNRESDLIREDTIKDSEVDLYHSQDYDLDTDIDNLNYVTQLNLAFKMVDVLGQIVRNNFGSLKKPIKYNLVEEAYNVGLRSLQVFFIQLQEDQERSVSTIKRYLLDKKIVDKNEIEDASRKILFNICELISYGFIKKISSSLGSEKLLETFEQVLENNSYPSFKLIDLCIKLEFERNFPYDSISKLNKEFETNYLAQAVLKDMVLNYVYMFPTSAGERQRICSILDISPAEQKQLEVSSVLGNS